MGLPIVALDAERAVDAATARTLRGLGFGGEVARDVDEYVQAALSLMDRPGRLTQHRLSVRDQMRRSALMDYPTRTAQLEKAYRLMWLNWLRDDRRDLSTRVNLDQCLDEIGALS